MVKKAKADALGPHLRVRLEPQLMARLEKSREKSGRTLTGEIAERLKISFEREDTQALMDATAARIAEKIQGLIIDNKEEVSRLINKEMFAIDVKSMLEMFPNLSLEEIEKQILESNDRRYAFIRQRKAGK